MNEFFPVESLTNASQVTFVLPHFMGPFCYIPSGMILKVEVKMTMDGAQGPNIPAAKKVAPANNTLHTLFRSCRVWLGETLLTKNGENYPFKSYFIDVCLMTEQLNLAGLNLSCFFKMFLVAHLQHRQVWPILVLIRA